MAGMTRSARLAKRSFDVIVSVAGLVIFGWIIAIAWVLAALDTRSNGFFIQQRIGMNARPFTTRKIRTMRNRPGYFSTVTTSEDPRITRLGQFLRRSKIDELPQLFNVLLGQMSFVGPRPDVPGFADKLVGDDRIILSVRPGITGPATIKYRDEEKLLASVSDPDAYNKNVIYPDKVRLNRNYIENWTFWGDVRYILDTILTI